MGLGNKGSPLPHLFDFNYQFSVAKVESLKFLVWGSNFP